MLEEPVYDNDGKIISTRPGNDPRPPILTHTTPDANGLRFIRDIHMLSLRGELESVGFSQSDLEWYKDILATANERGWFDPLDETYELPYLIAKGVIKKDDYAIINRMKGVGADGNRLPSSHIRQQRSDREYDYLSEMLDPNVESPTAPPRTYRAGLEKPKPLAAKAVGRPIPPFQNPPAASTSSNRRSNAATPRTGNASKVDAKAQSSTANDNSTATVNAQSTTHRKLGVKSLAVTTDIASSVLQATTTNPPGTTTLVPTQTASSSGTRVPKRGRESDVDDARTTKKGKIIEDEPPSPPDPSSAAKKGAPVRQPTPANPRKTVLSSAPRQGAGRQVTTLPKSRQPAAASGSARTKTSARVPAPVLKAVPRPVLSAKMPPPKVPPVKASQPVIRQSAKSALPKPSDSTPSQAASSSKIPKLSTSRKPKIIACMKPKPKPKD